MYHEASRRPKTASAMLVVQDSNICFGKGERLERTKQNLRELVDAIR